MKRCVMNCAHAEGDTKTREVIMRECTDCIEESVRLTDFQRGVLYAVSMLQITADSPNLGADILKEAGFAHLDCSDCDEMDKEALRIINQEKGMSLQGLN